MVPKVPRNNNKTRLFPCQSTFARRITTKQIAIEVRHRKKTISIAGIAGINFIKTFITAKKNVEKSIARTPSLRICFSFGLMFKFWNLGSHLDSIEIIGNNEPRRNTKEARSFFTYFRHFHHFLAWKVKIIGSFFFPSWNLRVTSWFISYFQ